MAGERVVTDPLLRAPEVCLYCDIRMVARDGGWVHAAATPCRAPRTCDPDERDLRWQDWPDRPRRVRGTGQRGGAAHIPTYGVRGRALCGRDLGTTPVAATELMPACRACLDWHAALDYGWRFEQHWRRPYDGTGITPLAELMGLRPEMTP